jgi:hypothetical protein
MENRFRRVLIEGVLRLVFKIIENPSKKPAL